MNRSAWFTLAVVLVAGAVTVWYSYLLQTHHMSGLPTPEADPKLLALSVIPTGLLVVAGLVRRRSIGMQIAVALAAVLVAALRVYVIRTELAAEWTHGTGLFSGAAWCIGMGVALVLTIVGAIAALAESARRQRR